MASKYVFKQMSKSANKSLKQTPVMRTEESGDVILASYPDLKPKAKDALSITTSQKQENYPVQKKLTKYRFLRQNRYRLLLPFALTGIIVIIMVLPVLNNFFQSREPGFSQGSEAAISNMRNGSMFNPSCDPTGAYTADGQHTIAYCIAWTKGYITSWNAQHPGFTKGYIYGWQPSHTPQNGSTVSSCQNCSTGQLPTARYFSGSTDGRQAAISDIQDSKLFDPTCDPTSSHASDELHTTEYCNGWTNEYIITWNAKHSNIPLPPTPSSGTCKIVSNNTVECTSKFKYINDEWIQTS